MASNFGNFPGNVYAPPGVYTRTLFENPTAGTLAGVKIPVLMGTGQEILFQESLEVVRGSSSVVDQQVPQEDMDGRAVQQITETGQVILGNFDGTLNRVQVRNFPIVRGDGTGTTTNERSAVSVTINGEPVVVLAVDGAKGVITLAEEPQPGDVVRVTYFFNRKDTLITDNVSSQVTSESALIQGEIGLGAGETFDVVTGQTDELILTVDQESAATITLPAGSFTAAQIVPLINGQATGTLVASTFENNEGDTAIQLTADNDIVVGDGSANALFGFTSGQSTARNRTFFTFQGPIVDGTNGGVTTTNPSDVVVSVDNTEITVSAVDGANRAVTLPFAPAAGSTVQITYYFNTWQDTFDYLANIGVTEVLSLGATPERSDFIQGTDFILQDDRILWGSAVTVSTGSTTAGATEFGEAQISTTLVDNKVYLAEAEEVVDTTTTPAVSTRKQWQLPFVPTTGNGRNTPLGQSLFQKVSNNRIDLPTNRPDLVVAYWGFSPQDALDRGPVDVVAVDSATASITLKEAVPVGARVWATFYYNTLADETYTLEVVIPGSASVGTYRVTDSGGNNLYDAQFGSKSAGLTGITVQFPAGSELLPDTRFEGNQTGSTTFTGPVEEVVTVTFSTTEDTPAFHSVEGPDPYYPIQGASDQARILVDGADLAPGAAGIDVDDPTGVGTGFFASLVGDEVVYDAPSGGTTYEIDSTNNEVSLTVDGVLISATAATGATQTLADYVTAINTAADSVDPQYVSATRFTSPYTVVASEYDTLTLHYTGDVAGASGNQTITLAPGTYNSVNDLVSQINTQLATINAGGGLLGSVTAVANADGRIVFELALDAGDASGFLEFIDGAAGADFAVIAGIDTDAATGGAQTKLYKGPIARRFTVGSGALNHDRLILRNRLVPGSGSLAPFHQADQADLVIQGSSGDEETGLVVGQRAEGAFSATVQPATLLGEVGFSGGQATGNADDRDSQPVAVFYDGTGTEAQNNVFKFTMDGTPVTVVFTASGSGTTTALGPGSISGTIIEQIADAMSSAGFGASASAVISAGLVRQEGAGVRIVSSLTDQFSAIEIGTGSANSTLGFLDGASDLRDPVDVRVLASALMSNAAASGSFSSVYMLDFANPSATYFAAEALAGYIEDSLGAEYLWIQSQSAGTSSSVIWSTATADDILLPGTGLLDVSGDGAIGEAGVSGFYVTSSDTAAGSGTADTSILNSGTGQDGVVGQTYRDDVTGLTFTVLEREGGFVYPTGESFTFEVSKTFTTDSNLPVRLPGLEVLVTNTTGTAVEDTAFVQSFERGGSEPAVGDLYYVTYAFRKDNFDSQLFTRLNAIEAAYGRRSTDNPLSLAAYLTIINGATIVGTKQVPKDEGTDVASVDSYVDALEDLVKPLPGGQRPDILVPLLGTSPDFFSILASHVDLQSSVRYQQERTAIIGLTPSVRPDEAGTIAQNLQNDRVRLVYPDSAVLSLTDVNGRVEQSVVEGFYLAAALAGSVVSPNLDVATPWTNRPIFGFDRLGRDLNLVEANQTAARGVTVLTEQNTNIKVRHGLTTDYETVLTRTPTIKLISDEVHIRARQVLGRFIGVKYLPGILADVEGTLSAMLTDLVRAQIIAAFTGVRANLGNDPTKAEVEAWYRPIFPLLYLNLTFHLRSSLDN